MSPDYKDDKDFVPTQPASIAESAEEELDPRIGKILAGRYRLDRVIGQGGLGRVYRATHLTLKSPVAVKFMLAEAAAKPSVRERFKREAAALSRLRHPGIVAAHDYGDDEGDLYIVMELVRGVSLASQITPDGGLMPPARVADILEQLLQVIEAAHGEGVVHRDLKPENVMLLEAGDRADHVKVLDFGIALMDDQEGGPRLTATDAVQGTPMYMSPEQCRGRDVGPPTDIYAIGAMLYEMLAGETPFLGRSLVDVMALHMFMTPPPIGERTGRTDVPAELERLAMWALAKKPEDRPTATQLRDALGAMARGAGTTQVAVRTHEERIRAMALSRNERGLPKLDEALSPTLLRAAHDVNAGERPVVLLAGFDASRAQALAGALAVQGMDARVWRKDAWPALVDELPVRAFVVASGAAIAGATAARANAATARIPILVADVGSATDTPALVRAGASDVGLSSVGDDVLGGKLLRLIRRGR